MGYNKTRNVDLMDIVILNSAYKHGINDESIYSCLYNCISDIVLEDPPLKRLFTGFDHRGNALEIIAWDDIEHNLADFMKASVIYEKYREAIKILSMRKWANSAS
jgi:hypothetical protein